jgi:hypothetical protein
MMRDDLGMALEYPRYRKAGYKFNGSNQHPSLQSLIVLSS